MHLHNLPGDGEAKPRTALRLGVGAVDLVELLEDARLVLLRNAGTRVGYSNVEVPVYRFRRDTHLASVGELNSVAHKIEYHLREALFVTEADRERLVHGCRKREFLVLGERLGCRAHRLNHALDGVFGHIEGEL